MFMLVWAVIVRIVPRVLQRGLAAGHDRRGNWRTERVSRRPRRRGRSWRGGGPGGAEFTDSENRRRVEHARLWRRTNGVGHMVSYRWDKDPNRDSGGSPRPTEESALPKSPWPTRRPYKIVSSWLRARNDPVNTGRKTRLQVVDRNVINHVCITIVLAIETRAVW